MQVLTVAVAVAVLTVAVTVAVAVAAHPRSVPARMLTDKNTLVKQVILNKKIRSVHVQ